MRKALAFAGFTHKSPRAVTYVRADRFFDEGSQDEIVEEPRGRSTIRGLRDIGGSRAMSL